MPSLLVLVCLNCGLILVLVIESTIQSAMARSLYSWLEATNQPKNKILKKRNNWLQQYKEG